MSVREWSRAWLVTATCTSLFVALPFVNATTRIPVPPLAVTVGGLLVLTAAAFAAQPRFSLLRTVTAIIVAIVLLRLADSLVRPAIAAGRSVVPGVGLAGYIVVLVGSILAALALRKTSVRWRAYGAAAVVVGAQVAAIVVLGMGPAGLSGTVEIAGYMGFSLIVDIALVYACVMAATSLSQLIPASPSGRSTTRPVEG